MWKLKLRDQKLVPHIAGEGNNTGQFLPPSPRPQVASNGLLMTFLGGFEGVVGVKHLSEGDHMTDNYPLKKKFKARVLWVNVADKSIGLTLQRQIVSGKAFGFHHVEIGDIFHGR